MSRNGAPEARRLFRDEDWTLEELRRHGLYTDDADFREVVDGLTQREGVVLANLKTLLGLPSLIDDAPSDERAHVDPTALLQAFFS